MTPIALRLSTSRTPFGIGKPISGDPHLRARNRSPFRPRSASGGRRSMRLDPTRARRPLRGTSREDGQDGHDGVDFCERGNAARRILLASGSQAFHASQMVNMTTPEGCNQKPTCRKTASFASLFDHLAKAILPFAVEKVSEVRCFSLVYPDIQSLLEHDEQ